MVDDEPMLLDLAATILQPLGFNVRTFRDPKKALAEYPAARPAVVVTDYAMGGMNGLDLVRECRRINPRQKMILVERHGGRKHLCQRCKPSRIVSWPSHIKSVISSKSIQALMKA